MHHKPSQLERKVLRKSDCIVPQDPTHLKAEKGPSQRALWLCILTTNVNPKQSLGSSCKFKNIVHGEVPSAWTKRIETVQKAKRSLCVRRLLSCKHGHFLWKRKNNSEHRIKTPVSGAKSHRKSFLGSRAGHSPSKDLETRAWLCFRITVGWWLLCPSHSNPFWKKVLEKLSYLRVTVTCCMYVEIG